MKIVDCHTYVQLFVQDKQTCRLRKSNRTRAFVYYVCQSVCLHNFYTHHPDDLDASSIKVNLSSPLFLVSDDFLSLTLDAGGLSKSWDISLTSPLLATLAKGLAPAMLRLGGTEQDFVLFSNSTITKSPVKSVSESSLDSGRRSTSLSSVGNVTVSLTLWDSVNVFAEKAGWDLIFGLNMLLRRPWPNGTWDSSNAELLMNYTQKKGYTVNWELGNGITWCLLYCLIFCIDTIMEYRLVRWYLSCECH